MSLTSEFEKFTGDIVKSFEDRIQSLNELKTDVRNNLKKFQEEHFQMANDLKDQLVTDVKKRREKIEALLSQFRDELKEVRKEIQEMHKIWAERKSH